MDKTLLSLLVFSTLIWNFNVGHAKISHSKHTGRLQNLAQDYPVVWWQEVNVTDNNGALTKSNGAGWNGGANSVNTLASGEDGWLEFSITTPSIGPYAIGFSTNPVLYSYTAMLAGFYVKENGDLFAMKDGVSTAVGTWQVGDTLNITRAGNNILLSQNGVVKNTIPTNVAYDLFVKAALSNGNTPSVTASFDQVIQLTSSFTPVSVNHTGGSITVDPSFGTPPYTYAWSTGATTATISNQDTGTYSVTVIDAAGRSTTKSLSLGYAISWKELTNITLVGEQLNRLTGSGWDAGAHSANYLPANANGWVEFEISTLSFGPYCVGLTTDPHTFGYTSTLAGFYINEKGLLYLIKEGCNFLVGTWKTGDVLRLTREGDQFVFKQNDITLDSLASESFYSLFTKASVFQGGTPAVRASFDQRIHLKSVQTMDSNGGAIDIIPSQGTAPYTFLWSTGATGASVSNLAPGTYTVTVQDADNRTATSSYAIGYPITWKDITNVTEDQGILTKSNNYNWDGGANSSEVLEAYEDGWIQFTLGEVSDWPYVIGFATNIPNFSYTKILAGFYIINDGRVVQVKDGVLTVVGSLQADDVFKVSREGDQMIYYQNGNIIAQTTIDPSLSYHVKAVLLHDAIPQITTSFSAPLQTPESTVPSAASVMANFAFQYRYDARNRMVQKKVPGADWVYMVYDDRDRLVMTQDGNQRNASPQEWTFTKYDVLNRPVLTGIYKEANNYNQQAMQDAVNTFYLSAPFYETIGGNVHGYTNQSFPPVASEDDYLTVTYYDDYAIPTTWGMAYNYTDEDLSEMVNGITYEQPSTYFPRVRGQVTATKVKNLEDGNWLKTVSYYDDKYRSIQTVTDHILGVQRNTSLYEFSGNVLRTKSMFVNTQGTAQNTFRQYTYDHARRLLMTHHGVSDKVRWTDHTSAYEVGEDLLVGTGIGSGEESVQHYDANVSLEVTVDQTNLDRLFGFSEASIEGHPCDIDYRLGLRFNGIIQIKEGNISRGDFGTYSIGDKFQIEKLNGVIYYKKNGQTFYTSTIPSTTAVKIKACFNSSGARLYKATVHRSIILSSNEYNELGELITKKLHSEDGTNFKQHVDYRYNIRGWLTRINDSDLGNTDGGPRDYFGMNLLYHESDLALNNEAQYNGNISATKWSANLGMSAGFSDEPSALAYTYSYDPMNRLKGAAHHDYKTNSWNTSTAYAEAGFNYDLNGNIQSLSRTGKNGTIMDILTYDYGASTGNLSNRLLSVTDAGDITQGFKDGNTIGDDYTYDANGNMIQDKNKDIASITYNQLNLPTKVTKTSGEYIMYAYDAAGIKLRQQVYNASDSLTKETDYVGEYIYENGELQFINHEEGRMLIHKKTTSSDFVHYTLDGNLQDSGSLELNGTLVGGEPTTDRNENNSSAWKMDGVDDYGQIPDHEFFNFGSGNFTVSYWVKKLSPSSGWDNTTGVDQWNGGGSTPGANSWSLACGAQNADTPLFAVESGNTIHIVNSNYTLMTGNWYHLTGVREDDKIKIYINGTLKNTQTIGNITLNNVTQPVLIGRILSGYNNNATFDEVIIQNKALSDQEIQELYSGSTYAVLSNYEYQYHLKDHLGNVRLTFTTKTTVEEVSATMEVSNADTEESQFLNYHEVHTVNSPLFDHTNEGPTFNAVRLMGGASSEQYGLAKTLSVMPGDTISAEVYAKYLDNTPSNWSTALANLISTLAGSANPGGTYVDGNAMGSIDGPFPFPEALDHDNDNGTGPKAYLNYIIFDKDYNYITGGFSRLSEAAREYGQTPDSIQGIAHERLFFEDILIKQPGYVYIYFSNEEESMLEVFFDDFTVKHVKGPVIQNDDYYPFGLSFNSYSRESSVENKYLYNGKEIQHELDLGWYDYHARQYDPTIGRFIQIDPLSEIMPGYNPYHYTYNNPIIFNDPTGMRAEYYYDWETGTYVKEKNGKKKEVSQERVFAAHGINTGGGDEKEQQEKEGELNRARGELLDAQSDLSRARYAKNVAKELTSTNAIAGLTTSIIVEFAEQTKEIRETYINDPDKLEKKIKEYVGRYANFLVGQGLMPNTRSSNLDIEEYRRKILNNVSTAKDVMVLLANTNSYVRAATTTIKLASDANYKYQENRVKQLQQTVNNLERRLSSLDKTGFKFGGGSFGGGGSGGKY